MARAKNDHDIKIRAFFAFCFLLHITTIRVNTPTSETNFFFLIRHKIRQEILGSTYSIPHTWVHNRNPRFVIVF